MRTPSGEAFRFRLLTEVRSGVAVTADVGRHFDALDHDRIAVVIDRNVRPLGHTERLIGDLKNHGLVEVFGGPTGEPDFEYLEALRCATRAFDPDLVLGVGGGSTMDSAKGLAIVLRNGRPCAEYQGFELYEQPGVPCVTIPTLFGSGAEMTPSAVFVNHHTRRKGGINGRAVFPVLALVDPELVVDAPVATIAASAIDALVHSIESYVANCATPVSRTFSVHAVCALFEALDGLTDAPRSVEHLGRLAEGSFYAIVALMHSEQGLAGAASYPMGAWYRVPHGVAGGRCLPHAIMFNAAHAPGLWDELAARTIGWHGESSVSAARTLAEKVHNYLREFQVPRLKEWLAEANTAALSDSIHAFRGVMDQNPISLTSYQVREFVERMLASEDTLDQW